MSRVSKQYVEYLDSLAPPLFKKCHRITKQEFESLLQDVKNVAEIYDCTPKSLKLIKIDFLKYSRIYDRNVQNRVSTQHHTEATIKSGDES